MDHLNIYQILLGLLICLITFIFRIWRLKKRLKESKLAIENINKELNTEAEQGLTP